MTKFDKNTMTFLPEYGIFIITIERRRETSSMTLQQPARMGKVLKLVRWDHTYCVVFKSIVMGFYLSLWNNYTKGER